VASCVEDDSEAERSERGEPGFAADTGQQGQQVHDERFELLLDLFVDGLAARARA
jgi:hypothetical protein